MKKIAIMNQKGGVGKTTTAINLAYGLSQKGKKVLLIDVDQQANLSSCFPTNEEYTPSINDFLEEDEPIRTQTVNENLEFLRSDGDLASFDIRFVNEIGREFLLFNILPQAGYDYVIIDCPPYLGLLTTNVLVYVDWVFVPLQTEYWALDGISILNETIQTIVKKLKRNMNIKLIIPTLFQKKLVVHRNALEDIQKHYGELVSQTIINRNVALTEASANRMDIFHYSPDSQGSKDYQALVEEVLKLN